MLQTHTHTKESIWFACSVLFLFTEKTPKSANLTPLMHPELLLKTVRFQDKYLQWVCYVYNHLSLAKYHREQENKIKPLYTSFVLHTLGKPLYRDHDI